jgi:glycosyltransferase involved in cell wall biosynthesis
MATPDVSIIIPVFNRRTLIRDAVDSAIGEASRVSLEVIVVDDCSTDDTWEVVSSFGDPVRAVRQERNSGQSAARNTGLDLARGKYVKFLDSDDVLTPGHLPKEVECSESEGADITVSGWTNRFADGTSRDWSAPRFQSIVDDVLAGLGVPTSAALYSRARCARWDPALRKLDDWDFFCQTALGAARIATLSGSAYCMREHAGVRATDVSMLANAREHHIILRKIEERLAAEGLLTEGRRKRLAQYYYKELRVLSLFDRPAFEEAMRHIFELDPRFSPVDEERQRWMRGLARLLGPRRAILLHSRMKRLVGAVRNRPSSS